MLMVLQSAACWAQPLSSANACFSSMHDVAPSSMAPPSFGPKPQYSQRRPTRHHPHPRPHSFPGYMPPHRTIMLSSMRRMGTSSLHANTSLLVRSPNRSKSPLAISPCRTTTPSSTRCMGTLSLWSAASRAWAQPRPTSSWTSTAGAAAGIVLCRGQEFSRATVATGLLPEGPAWQVQQQV
jgi:hypothetical protein